MRPTSKIGNLARAFALQAKESIPKTSPRMFKSRPGFIKWNVARVLALGTLMAVGVAVYFNMASGAANTASQNNQLENSSRSREQQKVADPAAQMPTHSLSEDLRIVPDDEWIYGQQDYEVARAANLERRKEEARATIQRLEAYIARNKAYEAARAANQARREAEAKTTMHRVEAYIATNKAAE